VVDGPDGSEAVLDLSAWPQQPAAPAAPSPVRRTSLPPRPVRRRRLPRVGLGRLAAGAFALAAVLLAVPVPATGCPSALSVWASGPQPLPSATAPALDDALVTADAKAVAGARAALVALDAQVAAARRELASPRATPSRHRAVPAASNDVSALEAAVRTDTASRDQAKAARDRLVEQQQAADDPSAYDADVAAAQEDLDVAEARLADDQRALAAARRAGAVVPAPSPTATVAPGRGTAQAVVDQAPEVRAGLVRELARAQQAQTQHLAQRRTQLSTWAARHAHEVAAVRTANARLASCGGAVRVPGTAGALLGLTGAGLVVLRRRGV